MDQLIKALALKNQIRVYVLNSTDTTNEAIKLHDLWPSAASVLSKVLSTGLMMGGMLKNRQGLTIKINGSGPIGTIIVDANNQGDVRGYVEKPHVHFENIDGGLNDLLTIGNNGYLDVIKDLKLKDLFTSTIALSGDLAQDFTYYFLESEQTPSAILLGVLIDTDNLAKVSGGILFQVMPNATDEAITLIENYIKQVTYVSELLIEFTPTEILQQIFDNDFEIIESKSVRFHCGCSKESFAASLKTLGVATLKELLIEDKKIEVSCHYCTNKYLFNEEEIKTMIKEIKV